MRVNAFGLAAGWKLCAKMRLSGFTHMIFRARNWKPRKSKWMSGESPRRFTSLDLVPKGQRGECAAPPAPDHGQAEADSERGEDTDLQGSGGGVRLLGLYVRADVLSNDWQGPAGLPAVKEEHQAHGRKGPRADRPGA